MSSLQLRRTQHSVIFLYKILRGLYDSPYLLSKISLQANSANTRSKSAFHIPKSSTNVGVASPITQMIRNYADI